MEVFNKKADKVFKSRKITSFVMITISIILLIYALIFEEPIIILIIIILVTKIIDMIINFYKTKNNKQTSNMRNKTDDWEELRSKSRLFEVFCITYQLRIV